MTRAERARQIDAEEFAAECIAVRERAFAYAQHKRDEQRRELLIRVYGAEKGNNMPLWPSQPEPKPRPAAGLITVDGVSLTLTGWAEKLGLTLAGLNCRRVKFGSIEAAIAIGRKQSPRGRKPKATGKTEVEVKAATRKRQSKRTRPLTYDGVTMSAGEWADHLGIQYQVLYQRICRSGFEAAIAMGGKQASGRKARRIDAPGVVSDFAPSKGTGGGSTAQESTQMDFSGKPEQ